MEYTPISYDDFIYELENGIERTNIDGIVCEHSAGFDADGARTWVIIALIGDYWTWNATHRAHTHDAYYECAKDTWYEAARDAYYELLKRHWI